jgi:Ribonuclease G/E
VKILAAVAPGEVRVAAVDGASLVDYALWRPGSPDGVGDLYRGRVRACMPALGGAFVALGGVDGFLPDSEGAAAVSEGMVLGVRVSRAAQGGKGPRLTAHLDDDERAATAAGGPKGNQGLLRRGPGAVERLAALYPDAAVIVDDAALVATLRSALGQRLGIVSVAFDDAIETAVEALSEPVVELPGGARMSVHPTPALTAIDVDLGAATADRRPKQAAQVAANTALLPALARQIRLRNLSGAILVDLAGLTPRRRAALGPVLAAALQPDPLRPRLLGFTALGLAEIVRTRVHPSLHELLAGPLAAGLAALRLAAATVAATPAWLPSLAAAPEVIAALQADRVALAEFARRAGRTVRLRAEQGLSPCGWRLDAA